jgi:anti-anti-sigma factor
MHTPGRLACRVEEHGDATHVIAMGDLDHDTRDTFEAAVQAVLTKQPGTVVLDLTAVPFLSSEGVSALIDADRRATDSGVTLTITPSPFLRRRLDMFGLTGVLTLTPDTLI